MEKRTINKNEAIKLTSYNEEELFDYLEANHFLDESTSEGIVKLVEGIPVRFDMHSLDSTKEGQEQSLLTIQMLLRED